MIRSWAPVLLGLLIVMPLHAQEADFRDMRWGMSPEEVKATETLPLADEDEEMIVYEDEVAGRDALVIYWKTGGFVGKAMYWFLTSYSNETRYIDEYDEIKEVLTTKYGPPEEDLTHWRDDLYRDDPSHWGDAVAVGDLVYESVWTTERTHILHKLIGNNGDVVHSVFYESLALQDEIERIEEVETLSDF